MSEKRLYEVRAEVLTYVVAETERQAEQIIKGMLKDDIGEWEVDANPVKPGGTIIRPWSDGQCLPYGDSEDKPVTDWVPKRTGDTSCK